MQASDNTVEALRDFVTTMLGNTYLEPALEKNWLRSRPQGIPKSADSLCRFVLVWLEQSTKALISHSIYKCLSTEKRAVSV